MTTHDDGWGQRSDQLIAHIWEQWDDCAQGRGFGAVSLCGQRTARPILPVAQPTNRCRACQHGLAHRDVS